MSTDHPSTIRNPEKFDNSPAAGFDGIFDWSWTDGCFGKTKISPMDFDGVVERHGNFLVFETKEAGAPIPSGQRRALREAYEIGCFTVILIQGKTRPETVQAWCQPGFKNQLDMSEFKPVSDINKLRKFVSDWYEYADANWRKKTVDVSFLNRKIQVLGDQLDEAKKHIEDAVKALNGTVEWFEW